MELSGKTLIITGAASGIGRSLAIECMRRGVSIAIADNDYDGACATKVQSAGVASANVKCSVHKLDVANMGDWKQFMLDVSDEHNQLDGIINNAGISCIGSVEQTTYDQLERVMSINFMGMVYGSKECLPLLKERPEALIANVSSIFGLLPEKLQSAYCASKYAIRGFTEVLAEELCNSNVNVSLICPGHIGTDIISNTHKEGNIASEIGKSSEVEAYASSFKSGGMPPEAAAEVILDGIMNKKKRIMVGPDAVSAV